MSHQHHLVYIGVGANLGDRLSNMTQAVEILVEGGSELVRQSGVYETTPVDCDSPQGDYLNTVIEIHCNCEALELLAQCAAIEAQMGRKRSGKNEPRVIDLDILLFDDLIIDSERLTIPHPRMHERRFVLEPLVEIAPRAVHPVTGKTVEQLLATLHEYPPQIVRSTNITDW